MALIGRLYGITSERRLCEEVRFNLAYCWFCRLPLDAGVPHHSTFSKNRHGRFRDAGVFRLLFEQAVRLCAGAGLIAHKDAAVDASFVAADASWQRKMRDADMAASRLPRPVHEWLADQANAPPQEHGVPHGKPAEHNLPDQCCPTKAITAALNAAGCSHAVECPASAITTNCAVGRCGRSSVKSAGGI